MSAAPMTMCPACRGDGRVFAHVNTRDPKTHGFQWITCIDCKGIGALSPDQVRLREIGADFRAARMRYGVGVREAAGLLDLPATEIYKIERGGRAPPKSWLYMLSGGKEIGEDVPEGGTL